MLNNLKNLIGFRVEALDGEAGKVSQILFDDQKWVVRYLVVSTGGFLDRTEVLVSPMAKLNVDRDDGIIGVNLTKRQIEDSPSIDVHQPVSRQMERRYFDYNSWPTYWRGAGYWGMGFYPGVLPDAPVSGLDGYDRENLDEGENDFHLRSSTEVTGYHLRSIEGEEFGHVKDFIVDDKTWAIHWLVVETHNWWPSRSLLVSPQWVSEIDWGAKLVRLELTKEGIKSSPEYDASKLNRKYEETLYGHYGLGGREYWIAEKRHLERKSRRHAHPEAHR